MKLSCKGSQLVHKRRQIVIWFLGCEEQESGKKPILFYESNDIFCHICNSFSFHTEPIRLERGQFNVRTDSHFLEPGFISVYAYNCEPRRYRDNRREFREEEDDVLSKEMEDVFLKGIRSLLTSYMQKELQPAIKETLMKNLGYTVSYGWE